MNTLFTGRHLIRLSAVGSTNTYALELLRAGELPEGALILAGEQVSGRGQRGNSWESEPGKNLTLSFVFRPHFVPVTRQFDLTCAVSLAVHAALQRFLPGADVRIKWPNDLLANGKKICGILIENVLNGQSIQASVAGIGLNVNQEQFSLPDAVSMRQLAGRDFDLNEVLHSLCETLEARYLQLRAGQREALRSDYLARLHGLNQKLFFVAGGQAFRAMVKGVTEEGLLRLEAGGEEKRFALKEVRWM